MTTQSRRAVLGAVAALAGGAAINAAAIVAAKAETIGLFPDPISDPIFALIERHRALFDAVETSEYEEGDGDTLDAEVAEVNEAHAQVLAAPFATPAGIAAMLRFLIEFELEPYDYTEHGGDFLRRLADALERKAVQS